jgi:2-methylisocitrate lyase-like PEP mutase family enzyme
MGQSKELKSILERQEMLIAPGCYDAMSARLIERAGFNATFMGGFAVSASRLGMPDTGLISYAEMRDQGQNICDAVSIPVLGDGDTGYGNAINAKRTVEGYAKAGMACVMIEDQIAPKRCGHTRGKQVVSRQEAASRLKAAVDAREGGADILIMSRTDANATDGLDEAIERCKIARDLGVDITFLEAPLNEKEMEHYCNQVSGPKMANMVEQGDTPFLPPNKLQDIGYQIAIFPVSIMLAAIKSMEMTLEKLQKGHDPSSLATFMHLQEIVGFPEYYEAEKEYTYK